jgi:hypothetical protein
VFKSPKKEIRIPEYDPKGFFEVDKVNGCILFKITKKNAEDILGMKTAGDKIFYIIRTFEERDSFGKVLNVTDEVEVYHGKWGDDAEFTTFNTENKVDLLTKSLATQVDKNAAQLNDYKELQEKYNEEVDKTSSLEKELEALRAERDSLQNQLNEYTGSTYDGTLLSTDTKYIAFEDTLENITFTEEQYQQALGELMTKGEVDLQEIFEDGSEDSKIDLQMYIHARGKDNDLKLRVFKVDNGSETQVQLTDENGVEAEIYDGKRLNISNCEVNHGDKFNFVLTGNRKHANISANTKLKLDYSYKSVSDDYKNFVKEVSSGETTDGGYYLTVEIDFTREDEEGNKYYYAIGNIGTLYVNTIYGF